MICNDNDVFDENERMTTSVPTLKNTLNLLAGKNFLRNLSRSHYILKAMQSTIQSGDGIPSVPRKKSFALC